MHIKNITINSIARSLDGKRLKGEVTFEIGGQQATGSTFLKMDCDTPHSNKIRSDAILVGDAIRQLRQLPELRNGSERLSFEPGMRPLATKAPAIDRQAS